AHKLNKRGSSSVNELSKEYEKYAKQTIESKPSIIDENNKFGTKMTQNAKQESQMGKLVREKQNKSVKETFQQYK
ncbi:MAG: hypothetical protein ACKOMW_02340, partial [Actinomycetes bacterium]